MKGPLEGIKILDLSQFISGPWCTNLLSTQGAEVIKVEPPRMGESLRLFALWDKYMYFFFSIFNLNKKSITLDIRNEEGQEIFKELIKDADVLVENFTPGLMKKWNLDYETVLKPLNPKLIYGSISGFGQTGIEKYVKKQAFDLNIQSESGILDALGVDGPPKLPFADFSSGNVLALGICQALYYREKTGKGQFIDLSMLDLMYAINVRSQIREYMPQAQKFEKATQILPTYNQFPTKDNSKVGIVVITEKQFKNLSNVLGKPEILKDKRFRNAVARMDHIQELDAILTEWTSKKTREEIIKILDENRIPCAPVLRLDEVRQHPQLKVRDMFFNKFDMTNYPELESATVPNVILRFSESPGEAKTPAPQLGEHNDEIYKDFLGFSREKINELKKKGII
ncbi:MAG: CoA transferase [Candidatus Lokiarchaeota archaeon]|nr:CoA transferase [Candidatus Lokiarchaeota archaeon]